ncbi:alpha/beta fold hydrolase [Salibacterium salarium]|uniref:Alpha/beta fold hydrolase n=1 Tax=Salibacterium salarium TaxID=284579 RepID=A0A428MTF6_9BACI|nr:alpha/beta fold hydrolase [Salibacterium salarium]RSL29400.1 alpha/beta fold hydrolase [Salibacterium salarium]
MDNEKRWKQFVAIWKEPTPEVGQTPKQVVWRKNKATLYYYPAVTKKYKTPLFLVYSLINQAFILDLGPDSSMIEAFTKEGYDVYLLDFGIPGYEDKDTTLDDYIEKYIQKAVQRSLRHAEAEDITVIGYCLGGTLAAIYAAIATEPIKNLILFAAPLDFSEDHFDSNLMDALKKGELNVDAVIDSYGVIPGGGMEFILRMATSPLFYSPYLALYERADDPEYVLRWRRFRSWVNGHVPFAGATLKQCLHLIVQDNQLINNQLVISGKKVNLSKIKSNLLVVSTEGDQLIPETLIKPVMNKVSSNDKTYKRIKGGHAAIALKGELPAFLSNWLKDHS